jgi:transposase
LSPKEKTDVIRLLYDETHPLTRAQVATTLCCSERSVARLERQFCLTGEVPTATSAGGDRRSLFTPEEKAQICQWVDDAADTTLEELRARCLASLGKAPHSLSVLSAILRGNQYTVKRLTLVPKARNDPPQLAARQIYAQSYQEDWALHFTKQRIVFCDETGFNLHTSRSQGRAKKGHAATVEVPTRRGGQVSCCCAISCDGPIAATSKLGAYNQDSFRTFLDALLARLLVRDAVHHWLVIADNVPFHKSLSVRAWFEQHSDHVALQFLPAYSPFLNPIEECFEFVKSRVRSRIRVLPIMERTTPALVTIVHDVLNHEIPVVHCQHWCTHSESFFPRCIAMQPISVEP